MLIQYLMVIFDAMTIGEQVKKRRDELDLNEIQFAVRAGIALDTLRRVEKGGNPTLYIIKKLQVACGIKFEI